MKDYYEILGVSENASNEQIKKQYRLLLHAWHPDKFPTTEFKSEAEEKIKDLNEAYDVLSNSVKRAAYNKQRILYKEVTVTSVQGDDGFSNKKEERNVSTHEKSTINFKRKKKTVTIPRVVISVITVFVLVFLLFVFQTNNFLPKAVPVTNTTRAPLPTSTKKVFSTPIIITPTLPVSDFIDEFGIPMNLISEGEFVMGSDNGEKQELPVHKVYVKSYYIDLYEVTNALYRKCYYEGACGRPRENNGGYDNVYLFNQQYNN